MLRVIRFGVPVGQAVAFDTFARQVAIPRVAEGGALSVVVGRSEHASSPRYAVASRFAGFEAMELEPEHRGSGTPRLLRIYTGRIAESDATEYYEFIRREAWPLIRARPGLVTAMFGRRVQEGEHGIAFVTAWSTEPEAATAETQAIPLRSSALVLDEQVELYTVVGSSVRN